MKSKISSNILKNRIVSFSFCASLIFIAVFCFSPERGVLSTFPVIAILPALSTNFYKNRKMVLLLTAFFALFLSVIEKESVKSALLFAILAVVFSFLGILIKRLIVTSYKNTGKKRVFCEILAVIVTLVTLAAYIVIFGNPISAFAARGKNIGYVKSKYNSEVFSGFEIKRTAYDYSDKRYYTQIEFADKTRITAEISAVGNDITDGYKNYVEKVLLDEYRTELVNLLRKGFSESSFAVRSGKIESGNKTIILGDNYRDYISLMSFDIAFYEQTAAEKRFTDLCDKYYNYLNENNFEFRSITFYGGNADTFLFQRTMPKDLMLSSIYSGVMPFNEKEFKSYKSDEDFMEYWNYK